MSRRKLPFNVECKSIYPFWETIAAFDCEPAAKRYASACETEARKNTPHYSTQNWTYRVTKRGKEIPINI
jgi:hypothetical protein